MAQPIPFKPERVYVDREVEGLPRVRTILDRLSDVPHELIDDVHALKHETNLDRAKREWIITKHRGRAFKPCQGMPCSLSSRAERSAVEGSLALRNKKARDSSTHSLRSFGRNDNAEHICCRYYVMDLVSGCPMDCSYCILQHYLENNPRTTIYANLDDIIAEVDQFLKEQPDKHVRIGTGELGDSLALDHVTGHAAELIPFFASQPNAQLELKTKTDFVDHLLNLDHRGHTVISWSVNADRVVREEERGTASLAKRFEAARKCVTAGYPVGFHFDPIVVSSGSDEELHEYAQVIDMIFAAVAPEDIAWISMGLLRLPYAMKAVVQRRFPQTRIFAGELVPAGNKLRYPRFLRSEYYRPLWDKLTKHLPHEKVYLCMETQSSWQKLDPCITCHDDLERKLTGNNQKGMTIACP